MLVLAFLFFVISIFAAVLGFGDALIAGVGLAQLLFGFLLLGFLATLVMYYIIAIDYKNKL
ncbi:MAG: DUF1328 domain-containing protein [Halobacteriovoraceae bacterium]|nr:DUF1328 domain-containing protein [Halobacteriovoraceae bacterium]|tara:strand:+ start:2803 stop:2985 length:183 start_codon:yes stop_codon:yes gene_type:complete